MAPPPARLAPPLPRPRRPGPAPRLPGPAPSLRPAAGGGCCSAAAAAAPLAAALGRASAGRSVRAAMELEVPDEAESAEAGAVTAEAAWAAESGAAAGNGPGRRVSPLPEWTRRASSPAGPSGAVRAPEGRRDRLRGGRSLPLGGAPGWGGGMGASELGTHRPGPPGGWNAPPGRLRWRCPCRGSLGEGPRAWGAGGCRPPF